MKCGTNVKCVWFKINASETERSDKQCPFAQITWTVYLNNIIMATMLLPSNECPMLWCIYVAMNCPRYKYSLARSTTKNCLHASIISTPSAAVFQLFAQRFFLFLSHENKIRLEDIVEEASKGPEIWNAGHSCTVLSIFPSHNIFLIMYTNTSDQNGISVEFSTKWLHWKRKFGMCNCANVSNYFDLTLFG